MRRRKPRSPFVVTVATAAFAIGCGGKFEQSPSGDAGTDTMVPGDAPGEVAIPSGCPASAPANGTPCAPEGTSCDYSACRAPDWRAGAFAQCRDGVWFVGASSCNPPAPVEPCPASEPVAGEACYRSGGAPACKYPDTCPSNPHDYGTNDYACVYDASAGKSVWKLTSPAYEAKCPEALPKTGDPCACAPHMKPGTSCNYGHCYGYSTHHATCDAHKRVWTVVEPTCNPPWPGDGGTDAP